MSRRSADRRLAAEERRLLERASSALIGPFAGLEAVAGPDTPAIGILAEHRQGMVLADDSLVFVGVAPDGSRSRTAEPWAVGYGAIRRVWWNRVDVLDRQECTIRLDDGRQVMIAPLHAGAWTVIRPHLATRLRPWPAATIGERLGGFLPPGQRSDRRTFIFVDSDRIVRGDEEHLIDRSTRAQFGYRPATSAVGAGSWLRGYGLQDLFVRRGASGMEAYVRIAGADWSMEMTIDVRDPAYAVGLAERVNELASQAPADFRGGQP